MPFSNVCALVAEALLETLLATCSVALNKRLLAAACCALSTANKHSSKPTVWLSVRAHILNSRHWMFPTGSPLDCRRYEAGPLVTCRTPPSFRRKTKPNPCSRPTPNSPIVQRSRGPRADVYLRYCTHILSISHIHNCVLPVPTACC